MGKNVISGPKSGDNLDIKGSIITLKNVYFAYPQALREYRIREKKLEKSIWHRHNAGNSMDEEFNPYVLRDISLSIKRGERVAILGPNGGGKSTLLKLINALLEPTRGEFYAFGVNVPKVMYSKKKMFSFRKKVGFVFQNPDEQLFSPTVFDDIAFGPLHLGYGENELEALVENIMETFGISHLRDKPPYGLSGGEKKKVALASVLVYDPEVILLDEPTVGLDPSSRKELINIINRLHERGKTIVTATHDVNAIPDIADRVYLLNRSIIAEGSTREIFSDVDLLKRVNLEIPEILKLFRLLNAFGYPPNDLPLSIDEAIEQLTRTIETQGGHIHLHIHEHTHAKINDLKNSINHLHAHEDPLILSHHGNIDENKVKIAQKTEERPESKKNPNN